MACAILLARCFAPIERSSRAASTTRYAMDASFYVPSWRGVPMTRTEDGTRESVPMPIEKLALVRVLPEVGPRVKKILTRYRIQGWAGSLALPGGRRRIYRRSWGA